MYAIELNTNDEVFLFTLNKGTDENLVTRVKDVLGWNDYFPVVKDVVSDNTGKIVSMIIKNKAEDEDYAWVYWQD